VVERGDLVDIEPLGQGDDGRVAGAQRVYLLEMVPHVLAPRVAS
jgi:hypothetical protein